jgi:hypothetical protein
MKTLNKLSRFWQVVVAVVIAIIVVAALSPVIHAVNSGSWLALWVMIGFFSLMLVGVGIAVIWDVRHHTPPDTADEYAEERGFTLPVFMQIDGHFVHWDKAVQADAEAWLLKFCLDIKHWGPPGLE